MTIKFSASTAKDAAAGAQAFADAYLNHREQSAQQDVSERLGQLNTQIAALNERLRKLTRSIVTLPTDSPARLIRNTQLQLVRSRYTDLQAQITSLDSARIAPGEIISDAGLPTSATSPNPVVIIVAACSLGLLSGLAVAWLTRFRYYRLGSGDDIEALTGAPLLASIAGGYSDPMTPTHHQILHVQQALNRGGHRVVVLYPVSGRIPVVSLTVALAEALAYDGRCVTIAADPQTLTHKRVIQLAYSSNVSTAELRDPGGRLSASSADPGRLVLVVGSPLDRQTLLAPPADCDAALVTIETGRTTAQQAQEAIQRIEIAGVPIDGVVSVGPLSRRQPAP
ncbi:MAG: hypothetical protein H0V07_06440 [Propionibacteriales bacterium]|nr:hypothetical protein [Propionibacteriales bacterium]